MNAIAVFSSQRYCPRRLPVPEKANPCVREVRRFQYCLGAGSCEVVSAYKQSLKPWKAIGLGERNETGISDSTLHKIKTFQVVSFSASGECNRPRVTKGVHREI